MITTVTMNASIDKAYFMDHTIENGTVMRVARCRNSAGGKGLNVARAIKLCGEKVQATGITGGFNGQYLESMLARDGIAYHFGHMEGETRCCINILDEGYGSTEYLEPGSEISAEEEARFIEQLPEIVKDSEIVTISGSVPRGMGKDIYAKIITKLKEAGKKVILDTSGVLLQEGMKAAPTLVKPNQDELELLFDTKIHSMDEVLKYAVEIQKSGIPYVAVSLGGEGALLVCEEGIYHGKPPKIQVVNTVGCGDSMVGGLAVALKRNYRAEEALRYAVAVSAANALSPNTGDFDPVEYQKIYDKVVIEKLR